MKPINIVTLLYFLLMSTISMACSGPPPPATAKQAFKQAKYVYLAIAENVKRTPIILEREPNRTLEEADFRVLEVWKGDLKPGDIVKYKEEVDGYSCYSNIKNNPAWLHVNTDESLPMAPEFSGIWLIYTSAKSEIGGFTFTRSNPIEHGGIADMKELYKLSNKKTTHAYKQIHF